ncbi:MAG TPA: amidohydrolase family protein [Vicinamibacterales bacterium]|jgi:imidazolonepropionase-like amidohydrolase
MRILRVALVIIAGVAVTVAAQQPATRRSSQGRPLALVGGTLIDGTGQATRRNSVVLIRGERIEKIGTTDSLPVPRDYEVISTEGLTILPGLWDLHVHLMYAGHPDVRHWFDTYTPQFERVIIPASAEQMLMAGVTTVRDLAAPLQPIVAVKKRIASGEIPGPSLYVAGPALTKGSTPNAVQTWNVSGAPDAKAKTSELIDAGVDWIKIINAEQLSPEEMKAIVDEAHARGRKVAAHAFSEAEIRQGLLAGVDDFQHVRTQTAEYPPDIVALIRDRVRRGPPLYWTVTAGANGQLNAAYLASNPEFLDDPANFIGLPQPIVDDVRKAIAARAQAAPRRGAAQSQDEINAIVKRKIAQIRDLGVQIVFGTDVGSWGEVTGQATWMEADLWVRELGVDPMTVIRAMTLDAARLMGADRESGSLTDGKFADVIAVRGDPLRHIDVLRDPRIVIKHGRRFK